MAAPFGIGSWNCSNCIRPLNVNSVLVMSRWSGVKIRLNVCVCVCVCVCMYIKEIYLALTMHSSVASLPATTVVSLGPITIAGATSSDSGSVTEGENMSGSSAHKSHLRMHCSAISTVDHNSCSHTLLYSFTHAPSYSLLITVIILTHSYHSVYCFTQPHSTHLALF